MANDRRGAKKMEREYHRREAERRKQQADKLKAKHGIVENQTKADNRGIRSDGRTD
jgi:hypothetical protein